MCTKNLAILVRDSVCLDEVSSFSSFKNSVLEKLKLWPHLGAYKQDYDSKNKIKKLHNDAILII